MRKTKFGTCLVKRRFNKSRYTPHIESVTQHTNIDTFFENASLKSSLEKIQSFTKTNRIPHRLSHLHYSKEEFKNLESLLFDAWKASYNGYIFERNLEVWRQFWIAIERSDVVVQVVDVRCLELFVVRDIIENYPSKKHLLLLNKCDLIGIDPCEYPKEYQKEYQKEYPKEYPKDYQKDYQKYFKNEGVKKYLENIPSHVRIFFTNDKTSNKDTLLSYGKATFAFTGFPNVGKSSTINNLFNHKRVRISKTPGKTKYLQSLYVTKDCVVIDTPGIVFPTEDKRPLLLYGVLNVNTYMEIIDLIDFVIEKIGIKTLIEFYKLKEFVNDSRNTLGMNFLIYFCQEMKCDNGKAIKIVVNDFMMGSIKGVCNNNISVDYSWFENKTILNK